MADQTSPSWNRHLHPHNRAHQLLKKATFKLRLAEEKDRKTGKYLYQSRTCFFISPDRWTIPAEHELRQSFQPGGRFNAFYKGKKFTTLKWLEDRFRVTAEIVLFKTGASTG